MTSPQLNLSEKEQQKRESILGGNLLLTILSIGLPLSLFQFINRLLRLFESFLASAISAEAASMVAYFAQMNLVIVSTGGGLAVGVALKVGLAYGAGDYIQVKKIISSMLTVALLICVVFSILIVPTARPFLNLIGTPTQFIDEGIYYFKIGFVTSLLMFFNTIYLAIEKSQGNAKRLLVVNLLSTVLTLSITAIGVLFFDVSVTFLAIAGFISQLLVFFIALYYLLGKSEVFAFDIRYIELSIRLLAPIIAVSLPIMFSRMIFDLGKAVVNSMLVSYGPLVVGASGIGGLLAGLATTVQFGMQESGTTIMTQNRGAGQMGRVFKGFKSLLMINAVAGVVFFVPFYLSTPFITGLFAANSSEFHAILIPVVKLMMFNCLSAVIQTSSNALFLTMGHTKILSFISLANLFIFRIPLLWFYERFTTVGVEVAGLIMKWSNMLTAVLSLIFLVWVWAKIRRDSLCVG